SEQEVAGVECADAAGIDPQRAGAVADAVPVGGGVGTVDRQSSEAANPRVVQVDVIDAVLEVVEVVGAAVAGHGDDVGDGAAHEVVGGRAAGNERVVAVLAQQDVDAGAAGEGVAAVAAVQLDQRSRTRGIDG